jgi:hypothetical protein
MQHRQLLIAAIGSFIAFGCHHNNDATEVRQMDRPVGGTAQAQSNALENDVMNIMKAPTPAAEADALRRLHRELSDRGLTYTINTTRTYDGAAVPSASVGNQPIRAEVTIFRGRDVVRTFNFVPQDNRNLALLGQ